MNVHKNARLTPLGRERIVRAGRERADAGGRRRSRRRLPADGSQVGLHCIAARLRLAEPVPFQATTRSGTRTLSLVSGP
jgi:hypothetical protein